MSISKLAQFTLMGLALLLSACTTEYDPNQIESRKSPIFMADMGGGGGVEQYIDTDGDDPMRAGCVWITGNKQGFGDCLDDINAWWKDGCFDDGIRLREQLACGQGVCCALRGGWTYNCDTECKNRGFAAGTCGTAMVNCNNMQSPVAKCVCTGGDMGTSDMTPTPVDLSMSVPDIGMSVPDMGMSPPDLSMTLPDAGIGLAKVPSKP